VGLTNSHTIKKQYDNKAKANNTNGPAWRMEQYENNLYIATCNVLSFPAGLEKYKKMVGKCETGLDILGC
jgi:hypothetical protein